MRPLALPLTVALSAFCLMSCGPAAPGPAGAPGLDGAEGPAGPAGPPGEDAPPPIALVDALQLPAAAPYPTGMDAAADGSLYVGSLFGAVVKFAPTSTTGQIVIPGVGPAGTVLANIAIDQATDTLYACGDLFGGAPGNPFANPAATLYAFDLDGNQKAAIALPNQGSSLCEDIAVDVDGSVYVTDAFLGAIYVVPAPVTNASALTSWATSALLAPDPTLPVPPFGAHGITLTASDVFVSNFSTSAIVRVPRNVDRSADEANIAAEAVTISNPEKLLALDDTHMLAAENTWCATGSLDLLTRPDASSNVWTVTVLKNGILGATGFAIADDNYYTTESQVCAIVTQLAGGPTADPVLPFWIDRVSQ